MSAEASVSRWIQGLKEGDSQSARKLWAEYYERLVALARRKLAGMNRRVADEEDIVQSAFARFCIAAENGRFPEMQDRHDLWRLLVRITADKAIDRRRYETRERRGAGNVRGESVFIGRHDADRSPGGIDAVIGESPTPEFAAMVAEQCGRLLDELGDDTLRTVAVAKMEGYTNQQIAEQRGCALSTIERQLRLIRTKWSSEVPA